jgi:hypothetical protein
MLQAILKYHKDNENHWVAVLQCEHFQHVRHNPPWSNRPWVESPKGRENMVGHQLNCKKCDDGAPKDTK